MHAIFDTSCVLPLKLCPLNDQLRCLQLVEKCLFFQLPVNHICTACIESFYHFAMNVHFIVLLFLLNIAPNYN